MSVVRIPRKIKTFQYEGITYALRRLTVGEMSEVTRLTSLYLKSTRSELKEVVADGIEKFAIVQGDLNIMQEAKAYLAKTAVIDASTHLSVFSGEEKIENQDSDFIDTAWEAYKTDNTEKKDTQTEESSDRPLES